MPMTARYCSLARQPAPVLPPGLAAERVAALVGGQRMWANATVLHYCFLGGDTDASVVPMPGTGRPRRGSWAGTEEQRDVVRDCFREWRDLGIGLGLEEVRDGRRRSCASASSPATGPGRRWARTRSGSV